MSIYDYDELDEDSRKETTFQFRLTVDERAYLDELARKNGTSPSQYLREVINEGMMPGNFKGPAPHRVEMAATELRDWAGHTMALMSVCMEQVFHYTEDEVNRRNLNLQRLLKTVFPLEGDKYR